MFTAFLIAVLLGTSLALAALLVAAPSRSPLAGCNNQASLTLVSLILILSTLAFAQVVLA